MSILTGCGIGHPIQNNISIDAIIPHFPNVIWYNWMGNRNGVGRKLRHLWRPTPGDAEWLQAVEDSSWYWNKFKPAWWEMPIWSIPVMENEPHLASQSNHTPSETAEIMHQWVGETGGAPFVGFKVLHNEVANGLSWRRAYQAAGGPEPLIEAFDLYGYSGSDIIRYAADCLNLVRSGEIGTPNRRLWLMEVGSWGKIGDWVPTHDSIKGVMDAAAYLTTAGFDLALWFSTHYQGDNGFWIENNLVTKIVNLRIIGKHWQGYVDGTRPISAAFSSLWASRIVKTNIFLPSAARAAELEFLLPPERGGPMLCSA